MSLPTKGIDSTFKFAGAEYLAKVIADYWLKEGYPGIETRVERSNWRHQDEGYFVIRSNIGPDGFPPREKIYTITRAA